MNELEEYVAPSVEEMRSEAYRYMDVFFKNKKMFYGGPVPSRLLYTENNFRLVCGTEMADGVDLAYKLMSVYGFAPPKTDVPKLNDQRFLLDILTECSQLKIPKEYAAGILLIYLRLCKGVGED